MACLHKVALLPGALQLSATISSCEHTWPCPGQLIVWRGSQSTSPSSSFSSSFSLSPVLKYIYYSVWQVQSCDKDAGARCSLTAAEIFHEIPHTNDDELPRIGALNEVEFIELGCGGMYFKVVQLFKRQGRRESFKFFTKQLSLPRRRLSFRCSEMAVIVVWGVGSEK